VPHPPWADTLDLDLYEIAFLSGGPDRVVDTAVVALVETGRVRMSSPGQLAVADHARRHPVEGAVLDAIGTHGHRSLDLVTWRLAGDDRITDIGRRLTAEGLLSRRPTVRRHKGGPPLRTTAGKRLLRALEATPPVFPVHDGGSTVQVALHGRARLSDELRVSIFEPVPVSTADEKAEALRERLDATRTGGFIGRQSPGGPVGTGGVG
jgi:hypothetical protein